LNIELQGELLTVLEKRRANFKLLSTFRAEAILYPDFVSCQFASAPEVIPDAKRTMIVLHIPLFSLIQILIEIMV
jgi:hypothetical protein